MTGGFELIGGFTVTWNRLYIVIFCFLVLGALALMLKRTVLRPQRARGDAEPRHGLGHGHPRRTRRCAHLRPRLGHRRHGRGGASARSATSAPTSARIYIVDSFLVVVFGGVGSLMGTLVGAMGLGIANKFLEPFAGAILGKVVVLVAIILFIQKRPRGLFALKGRAAES